MVQVYASLLQFRALGTWYAKCYMYMYLPVTILCLDGSTGKSVGSCTGLFMSGKSVPWVIQKIFRVREGTLFQVLLITETSP